MRKQKPGFAPQDVAAIIAQHNTQVSMVVIISMIGSIIIVIVITTTVIFIVIVIVSRRESRAGQRLTEAT